MKDYSKRYPIRLLSERISIITTNIQNAQSYDIFIDYRNGVVRFAKYVGDILPRMTSVRMNAINNMSYNELVDFGKQL